MQTHTLYQRKNISFDALDAKYEKCAVWVYLMFVLTPQRLEDFSGGLETNVGVNLLLTWAGTTTCLKALSQEIAPKCFVASCYYIHESDTKLRTHRGYIIKDCRIDELWP